MAAARRRGVQRRRTAIDRQALGQLSLNRPPHGSVVKNRTLNCPKSLMSIRPSPIKSEASFGKREENEVGDVHAPLEF